MCFLEENNNKQHYSIKYINPNQRKIQKAVELYCLGKTQKIVMQERGPLWIKTMDEIRKAPSSQQNSAITNARGAAVGRSHGVESFQNVDMALSFCVCVCF